MKKQPTFFVLLGVVVILLATCSRLHAQTGTTGTVLGTVSDPSGAAIADAPITLRNRATNNSTNQNTNSAGQYTFVNVVPGDYEISVKQPGFRAVNVLHVNVDVAKSYTVDIKLEVGQVTESVTVTTEARVELQTTDAQVGDVVGGTTLARLPTLQRDASELLTLQPGTTPYDSGAVNGTFGNTGGTVAGARSDQNTILMDGIDITDNTVGGGSNATNFIPTGVESLEEFKVGVSNANATFNRASGGQITLISKGGTNNFHGDAYWFHQSDGYNANSWDLNRIGQAKTPFKDNREGVSIGGPIFRNKTFFFSNYEKRRFPAGQVVTRIVPTDALRSGILEFQDNSGVVQQYNLATSTACGPSGGLACDPRGIGISPTVQALYSLNPAGNDSTVPGADGNNTNGFRATATTPIKQDFVTFRLDHSFSDHAHFFGRYIYSRNLQVTPNQIDTLGGKTIATTGNDLRGDGAIGAFDYAFNTTTTNTIRYGWIRSRNFLPGLSPSASASLLALPGTDSSAGAVALAPGLGTVGLLDVPIDVDTQRARTQGNFQSNKQLVDDFSKIWGKHTIVAGGGIRWLPITAQRNDKVVGSLASLVALMDADGAGGASNIPGINRPPTCSTAGQTFCLQAADVVKWDRFYAATLGLVDNVSVLAVRDGSLTPQPFGTPLISQANMRAYDTYVQDTWRIKPTFTVTLGLSYGWQTPPHEAHREQTFIVDATNNSIFSAAGYIKSKEQAALAGQAFNPTIGYLPINDSGRSNIYEPDYGDVGPRVSAAWSPSYSDGLLGHLFGTSKTVLRAGFGIYYDRINNVQSVEIPQLGVGFAQTLVLKSPTCDASGAAGVGCNAAAGTANLGASAFRVGVDGTIPTPTVPTVSSPIVPANPFGEVLSFALDPSFKVGRSYSFDFTIQRELPGNMLMEVGYIGRLGRDLPNSVDFDSSPYMLKDQASGQTFAQAFDNAAAQVAAKQTVTPQPWFENQLPGFGALSMAAGGCGGGTSTACLVSQNQANFQGRFVSNLFQSMGFDRQSLGLLPYNNLQVVLALFMRTHSDRSNYNAATFTLRKRPSHGLQFDLNYTYSKSLDQLGGVQNNAGTFATSFNPALQYGPSLFDRTHVFNAIFNYDLPAGRGHRFSFSNSILDKVISGWYVSGVFRANSGLPLQVIGGDFGGGPFASSENMIATVDPSSLGGGAHFNVTGATTFGTTGSVNLFRNPDTAAADFRYPLLSSDGRDGSGHPIRGLGLWNLDSRLGKQTSFHERFKIEISADFFNIFNHPNFFDPQVNINNPKNFGVISTQLVPADRTQGSRWIELGLRVSF